MSDITLMIPMNGLGNRFRNENYHTPKPLINVIGKPMIFWLLDNLNLNKVDSIIIPYTTLLDNFAFQPQLNERYPNINFTFVPMNYDTKGAAETVSIALDSVEPKILENNIMILDCDTFYFDDIISTYCDSETKNQIFYFNDHQENPIYSYVKLENDRIIDIKEKEKISDHANCGVYCFDSGNLLQQYCKQLLERNQTQKNEFYLSGIYQLMLNDSVTVSGSLVENFHCVGTPLQLKIFCETHQGQTPERFCFDLDRTLVTHPAVVGDYTTCRPIERTINLLRHLKSQGHYIIIYTARRMRTHKGQLGKVMKEIGQLTYDQLEEFNIPYDEIHFGKPYARFYIDDLAVNAFDNIEKQIGYYNSTIKSRSFNKVEILENMVIKSGDIQGEQYYYKQLNQKHNEVLDLFPRLLESSNEKIIIEKVQGLNFSYLYTNDCLMEGQFKLLLSELKRLHSIKINDITVSEVQQANINKIKYRYDNYDYSQFYDSKDILDQLINFYSEYEPAEINMIHGDPVFTNVLIDHDNKLKFIDMRGKQHEEYTVGGDPIYDMAKVYQSLTGYDHILNNTFISSNKNLIGILAEWIDDNYKFSIEEVKRHTAGLYFSLIPLHDDERCQQYYQIAKNIINNKEKH